MNPITSLSLLSLLLALPLAVHADPVKVKACVGELRHIAPDKGFGDDGAKKSFEAFGPLEWNESLRRWQVRGAVWRAANAGDMALAKQRYCQARHGDKEPADAQTLELAKSLKDFLHNSPLNAETLKYYETVQASDVEFGTRQEIGEKFYKLVAAHFNKREAGKPLSDFEKGLLRKHCIFADEDAAKLSAAEAQKLIDDAAQGKIVAIERLESYARIRADLEPGLRVKADETFKNLLKGQMAEEKAAGKPTPRHAALAAGFFPDETQRRDFNAQMDARVIEVKKRLAAEAERQAKYEEADRLLKKHTADSQPTAPAPARAPVAPQAGEGRPAACRKWDEHCATEADKKKNGKLCDAYDGMCRAALQRQKALSGSSD